MECPHGFICFRKQNMAFPHVCARPTLEYITVKILMFKSQRCFPLEHGTRRIVDSISLPTVAGTNGSAFLSLLSFAASKKLAAAADRKTMNSSTTKSSPAGFIRLGTL